MKHDPGGAAVPVEDESFEFMATSTAAASGSLDLGSTNAGCAGCVDKDTRQQVKSAAQFPYAAIGAQ
jgi:V8-like Glu-specific endopeptidase